MPLIETQQSVSDRSTYFVTQASVGLPKESSTSPTLASSAKLPLRKPSFVDHATPSANVSAFCRSVLEKLVPHEFWGVGDAQSHNRRLFMRAVDRFIRLRRFESLTLHDTCQGMKVGCTARLAPVSHHNCKFSRVIRLVTLHGLLQITSPVQECRSPTTRSVWTSSTNSCITYLTPF